MRINAVKTVEQFHVGGTTLSFYSLKRVERQGLKHASRLPASLKILLENTLRHGSVASSGLTDLSAFAKWLDEGQTGAAVSFYPRRMIIPESSGLPLLGDLACMRDAMANLGGNPHRINPKIPIDLFVDHSVTVDAHARPGAALINHALEMKRNAERYSFLRWASRAFDGLRIFPPGSGICHQINLEYLANVVEIVETNGETWAIPDTLIGMDSHTPMINALSVLGWGVGGLEGTAVSLGEPVSLAIPEVIGCRLLGKPRPGVTSTDIVLSITQILRQQALAGKFVEFLGPGLNSLSLSDRATIANMAPETGATVGFFPVDDETLRYLALTGRPSSHIEVVRAYAKLQGLWRDDTQADNNLYTSFVDINLENVAPSVAGPSRPHQRVDLAAAPIAFSALAPLAPSSPAHLTNQLQNGDVVLAAITSCTNTANPSSMITAGLLARNAVAAGLMSKPWVKTSLSPGSKVVAAYLEASGLQTSLDALGFNVAGFGCMTCMGNSGPLPKEVDAQLLDENLVVASVISGNRNFEGRVHPKVRANFLASPPLVIAYALAGTMAIDLTNEPLGSDRNGSPVYLRDIWPDDQSIRKATHESITTDMYQAQYKNILKGSAEWDQLAVTDAPTFPWNDESTFIRRPPFLDNVALQSSVSEDILNARVLGIFGDMLTTDHISPIGVISAGTPAAEYLESLGVNPSDFVSYAARRLNHDVMVRGTFANIHIRNEMTPDVTGSSTLLHPASVRTAICSAAEQYRREGVPLVIIGGKEYGAGSSRDWAAKGTRLLGVRAVIAESFERIHRSNLLCMGVLPLQFPDNVNRKSLALKGDEIFSIVGISGGLKPLDMVDCVMTRMDGSKVAIPLHVRLDTQVEIDYFQQGGILHYVLRQKLSENKALQE